jgi:hypothetical protein
MDSQVLFTKNDNGTIAPILGLNASTILTTTQNLSQLSDVDTTNAGAQRVLTYNATTEKWEPVLPSIAGLSDVLFSDLQASNVIKWSGAPVNKWVNRDLGYAIMTIQGQIKDSVINTNSVKWNILNPDNYETGTFTITPFTNNSIDIDTTTNFQVGNLVVGANYRVEMNFNYNILTATGNNNFDINIENQGNSTISFIVAQINTGNTTLTTSLSTLSNNVSAFKFTVNNTSGLGTFTGTTPLNLNCVISVIEM